MPKKKQALEKKYIPSKEAQLILGILFLGTALKMNWLLNRVTGNYRWYVNAFRTFNLALLLTGLGGLILSVRGGRYILSFLSVVLSFSFLTILYHYRYFGSIATFFDIKRLEMIPSVKGAVLYHVAGPWDILFFLDPLILVIIALIKSVREKRAYPLKRWFFASILIASLLLQVAQCIAFDIVYNKDFKTVKAVGNASFINCYGIGVFFLYDIYHTYKLKKASKTIVLKRPENPDFNNNVTSHPPGKFSGANVILLQVESLDHSILFHSHNETEITPNLNRLAEKNILFERYFAQHNTGTVDTDYSVLTSEYAPERRTPFTSCNMEKFPSLPDELSRNGYHTVAMHANRGTFYNRRRAFRELGFTNSFFAEDFPAPPEGEWTIDDLTFLKHAANNLEKCPMPFFAYLITITSHTPYNFYPEEHEREEFLDAEPSLVRNYYQSIHYVDNAIGEFLELLESHNLRENTIIFIFGEQCSILHEWSYSGYEYITDPIEKHPEMPEHVPMILIPPEPIKMKSQRYSYPGDVAPTVMELLGIESDTQKWTGISLFSSADSPIIDQGNRINFLRYGNIYTLRFPECALWKKTIWSDPDAAMPDQEYLRYIRDLVNYSNKIILKHAR